MTHKIPEVCSPNKAHRQQEPSYEVIRACDNDRSVPRHIVAKKFERRRRCDTRYLLVEVELWKREATECSELSQQNIDPSGPLNQTISPQRRKEDVMKFLVRGGVHLYSQPPELSLAERRKIYRM